MNRVVVALDFETTAQAVSMARIVRPYVGAYKVGLELLWAEGPEAVTRIAREGLPVFVDAKLHDIPNTVRRAAVQLRRLGARWVSVHATGGDAMMAAAVEGLATGSDDTGVLAVTVLTSMDAVTMASVGLTGPAPERVGSLAVLAKRAGAEGVVCSVAEIPAVTRAVQGLLLVTPGIRVAGASPDDQARVSTPGAAIAAGAGLIVVGRAITGAPDPAAAAAGIAKEVALAR